ncbi:hypothetical protein [Myxococcus sp. AB036A]|uniref:hypothetical protein n=1 Tax=Myxococcus sp. AB036A TaxID=2562793 RepID=UPI001E3B57F1|nr:hypothetical protein [Myxococcus sp. AB036A]
MPVSSATKSSTARCISIGERVVSAMDLTLRVFELTYYKALLTAVERSTRLPRTSAMSEAMRLYRENIVLKTQSDLREAELDRRTQPAPLPMATRAAQVFAYFLTRGNEPFTRHFLSASVLTSKRWATLFRS